MLDSVCQLYHRHYGSARGWVVEHFSVQRGQTGKGLYAILDFRGEILCVFAAYRPSQIHDRYTMSERVSGNIERFQRRISVENRRIKLVATIRILVDRRKALVLLQYAQCKQHRQCSFTAEIVEPSSQIDHGPQRAGVCLFCGGIARDALRSLSLLCCQKLSGIVHPGSGYESDHHDGCVTHSIGSRPQP